MALRTIIAALGAEIAVFLVATVLVIELLDFEFSAIVGLPVGVLGGGATLAFLLSRYSALGHVQRSVVDAVAGFGVGIVLMLGVSYVNLANLSFDGTVATAIAIGVLAGFGSWVTKKSPTSL